MFLFKDIDAFQDFLRHKRQNGHKIGFIPTMGALHQGHLSLIKSCKQDGHLAVCSVFVNPNQFNQQEDFDKYPRDIVKDMTMLTEAGCDVLFHPEANEIYPKGFQASTIDFGSITNSLEGYYRPGHFDGVITIVKRLFEIVEPHHAYFGQKDFQQCAVVAKLINHYGFDIELHVVPIVRETNGLAMSSRNARLNEKQQMDALQIFATLNWMRTQLGKRPIAEIIVNAEEQLNSRLKTEYVTIVDASSLEPIQEVKKGERLALLIAAWCGPVRLIDNWIITE